MGYQSFEEQTRNGENFNVLDERFVYFCIKKCLFVILVLSECIGS